MNHSIFMETLVSLLAREHCVVIPEFGAIISKQADASLNYLSKEVRPAHTSVIFNAQISSDDGMLTNELRTLLNVQYRQAYDLIQSEIEQLKAILFVKKMVSFAPLGNFFLNSQHEIFFIGSNHLNLDTHYFGLKPIRWVVNQPEQKNSAPEKVYQPYTEQTSNEKSTVEVASEAVVVEISSEEQTLHQESRRKIPFWNVAANIAFASLALGVLYLNSLSWKSMLSNANTQQASAVSAPKSVTPVKPEIKPEPLTEVQKDSIENSQTQLMVVGGQVIPIKKKTSNVSDSMLSNAEFKAKLIDKKGKYFVVAGSHITEDAAKIECLQWRKLNRNCAYFHIHNSSLIRVVLDRFESGKKASAFAVSIKNLPSNTISVQELSLVK